MTQRPTQEHQGEARPSQAGMMTATQYRSRAAELRAHDPNSRAAALYERLAELRGESDEDKLADEYRARLGLDAWNESDHPRGGDPEHPGRFSKGSGGGSSASEGEGGKAEGDFGKRLNHYLEKKAIGGGEYRKLLARVIKEAQAADMPLAVSVLAKKMIESWTITAQNMARKGRLEEAQKIASKIKKLGGPDIQLVPATEPDKPAQKQLVIPERKGKDSIASLTKEYGEFQRLNNLQLQSAEEELANPERSREEAAWIRAFADRWNVVWEEEQIKREKKRARVPRPEQKPKTLQEHKNEVEERRKMINEAALRPEIEKVAASLSYPMEDITIRHDDRPFTLNGREYKTAGLAYHGTGRIEIFANQNQRWTVGGVLAHEIMHQKYNAFIKATIDERQALIAEYRDKGEGPMAPNGLLKPEAAAKYPLYALHLEIEKQRAKFAKSDGVTDYSRQYWARYEKDKGVKNAGHAFHETLAEMEGQLFKTGKLPGAPEWQELFHRVNDEWKKHGKSRGFARQLHV